MEVELFSNGLSEEDTVEADADIDNFDLGAEGERCGICMDVVIDRGVLDCCQHWFCFVCIDNWATITNLCPLCQNEFQLITCIPVFDTVGSGKNDEDSDSRDGDWCVEGKNDTLSFPSYYIDENAVTCLDGDGCKIRSGSVPYEETLTLDTSIACDSCDIWYHAFCVGFDPEGADVDSWLCPRCLTNEADLKSDFKEMFIAGTNVDPHHLVETSSGKVSICVADTGETALVVSRIHNEDVDKEHIVNCSSEMGSPLEEGMNSVQLNTMVPFSKCMETGNASEVDDRESRLSLDLAQSIVSSLSDAKANNLLGHNEFPQGAPLHKKLEDLKADIVSELGSKRKHQESSLESSDKKEHNEGRPVGPLSTKKVKVQQGTRGTPLNHPADIYTPDDFQNKNKLVGSTVKEKNANFSVKKKKKKKPIDIMTIVQGVELRAANKHVSQKEAGKSAEVEKNAAGLRVKRIMRRPSENKESDAVVQKLKKEIREAVQKKPSGDIGKSGFDPNLLAAFRAAVAGSLSEPAKKLSSSVIKAKKFMLQKGKARENLTKKIYATSSGKRRRAWDRDCEIEFWKHRCMRISRPEKIETLRSVLNLLKKSPEATIEQNSQEESKAPILSRLYLADTSLFPRSNDIKPLSVLKAAASSNQDGALSSGIKCVESSPEKCSVNNLDNDNDPAQRNVASADDKETNICSSTKNGVASMKLRQSGQPNKKMSGKTDDVKLDKRKWALEVLARKTASSTTSSMHQKQDDPALKGNYPLLAELPTDMRPKLATTRQNKIPIPVRQAQLYRLAEHFLKMTNLSSMHRTAATELAIADAINIEKQVADRSHSKAIYLNLCSQEIRKHTNSGSSGSLAETGLSRPEPMPLPEFAKDEAFSVNTLDSEAEKALRAAGLLSDSPPSTPIRMVEHPDVGDDDNLLVKVREEEDIKSIFESDGQPELDIYGDFEYDLDEDDCIGATSVNAPNAQVEEGESKVKVVFSTFDSVRSDNVPLAKEQDLPDTDIQASSHSLPDTDIQASSHSFSLPGCPNDVNGSLLMEDKVDLIPLTGVDEELSVVECEELYGPDKEPSTQTFSDPDAIKNLAMSYTKYLDISTDANKVINDAPDSNFVGENSSNSSDPKRNASKEKNDLKVAEEKNDSKAAEEKGNDPRVGKKSELAESVLKKVEAYIKEHIRPLCKSGVITVEQYRWAVGKTSEKVMKYHSKAKNANFLIKEGEKVKKLAEQYVETAKHKVK